MRDIEKLQPARLFRFYFFPRLVSALMVFLLANAPPAGRADIFNLNPSVALREEFNDNIFFSSQDENDDFITTVSPGLEISDETERLFAGVTGRLDVVRYADNADLDATEQYLSGRARYNFTPRLAVTADAGYVKDFRPDRDIFDTGLVQSAEPRWRRSITLKGNYETGETTADTLIYRYDNIDYKDQEFADSLVQTLQFNHTWNAERVFERAVGRLGFGYARGDFETSNVDSYSGTLGTSWKYSELVFILFDAGLRYTRTEVDAAETSAESDDVTRQWSGIGEIDIAYRGEYTRANLVLSHDIRQAPGRGGTTKRTSLVYRMAHRFSEKFEGRLFAGYYRNKTDQGTVSIIPVNERTVRLQPSLQYDFTKDLSFETAYTLSFVKDYSDSSEAVQNVLFAEFFWRWPLFE